jgi:hypothetical protein
MNTIFTLETQMGKPTSNGFSALILAISGYNAVHGSMVIQQFTQLLPLHSLLLAKRPFESQVTRRYRRVGG